MKHQLPTPSSTWEIGRGGTVEQIGGPKKARRGRALVSKPRAESVCSVCKRTGHNARNKKKCQGWDPNETLE